MPIRLRIKELRETRNWTQQELADRSGVRQATISDLEAEKGGRLLHVIERLANALEVAPGYLIESVPTNRRGAR